MNKFLRYSLSVALALVASFSFAQEVTLDFSTNTWGFPEGSKAKVTEAAEYTSGEYTIKISKSAGHYWNNYASPYYLILGKKGTTLTLPAFNFDVEKIEVVGNSAASGSVKQNIYVGDDAVSTETTGAQTSNSYIINEANRKAGTVYDLKITSNHNTQITAIKIYKVGSTDTPDVPEVTYTKVASIKDLLANHTEAATNLDLTLTNAKVTYVNEYNGTVNAYVREGDEAIELRTLGFKTAVNSVINGNVKVDLAYSYGVPYLKANAGTDDESLEIQESSEEAEPVAATVKDILDGKHLNDLVTIKDFTFSKDEYQTGKYNYYANDGENKIMLYDKFSKIGGVANLTEGEKYTVVGIFGAIFKDVPEILPTKSIQDTTTGLSHIGLDAAAENAPAFNLAGQQVTKAYKGVVIKAGKKFVQK